MKINYDRLDWQNRSKEASDFIDKLINPDPDLRMSPNKALKHPWIESIKEQEEKEIDTEILERILNYHKINTSNICNLSNKTLISTGTLEQNTPRILFQILDVITTNWKGKTFKKFGELFKVLDYDGQGYISLKYVTQKLKENKWNDHSQEENTDQKTKDSKIGYS